MKIAVAGLGYVGLSNAVLLAQNHQVFAVDVAENRVTMVNQRQSPIVDAELETFLAERDLDLTATIDTSVAYTDAELTEDALVKLTSNGLQPMVLSIVKFDTGSSSATT